jgi:hypothetical protein
MLGVVSWFIRGWYGIYAEGEGDGQLDIWEFKAEGVGHDEDGIFGAAVFGVGEVCANWVGRLVVGLQ